MCPGYRLVIDIALCASWLIRESHEPTEKGRTISHGWDKHRRYLGHILRDIVQEVRATAYATEAYMRDSRGLVRILHSLLAPALVTKSDP